MQHQPLLMGKCCCFLKLKLPCCLGHSGSGQPKSLCSHQSKDDSALPAPVHWGWAAQWEPLRLASDSFSCCAAAPYNPTQPHSSVYPKHSSSASKTASLPRHVMGGFLLGLCAELGLKNKRKQNKGGGAFSTLTTCRTNAN